MGAYTEYLKKKHCPITKAITEKEYTEKKAQLPEDEFKLRYSRKSDTNGNLAHYEIIADDPSEQELTLFLLSEILEKQEITARKTSIIAGIVIFGLVCGIVAAVYYAVTLGSIF